MIRQVFLPCLRGSASLLLIAAASGVEVECVLWKMGGGVSGCGVLARYAAPGPGLVTVERTTVLGKDDGLPPITLLTVLDPAGRTVAWSELTGQDVVRSRIALPVPSGPAGIWRVSLQGGRNGDRIGFSIPPAIAWGVRGEMALGQTAGTGREGWLWVPPGTGAVLIEAIGGGSVGLSDAAGGPLPGTLEGSRRLWRWPGLPPATAVRLAVSPEAKAVAIDGMPGLICPDPASAADLRGGTSEESGRIVMGPLQARARRWMVAAVATATDLDPHLVFPAKLPADLPDPIAALQLYGAYGPLSGLRAACAAQILDPAAIGFGSLGGAADGTLHGPALSAFDALGLAAAIDSDTSLNPAHGSKALVNRATLIAFHHLSRLQGDDLIREGDIARNGYPITHAFFVYLGSLAGPYILLRPHLDAEAEAIWRDGLIAVGDRLADYRGYLTNQMWHVTLAHLSVYRATGEIRFRRWFERQVGELLAQPSNSRRRFGQHPAGWFLEDSGPDGNYDAISGTCLVEAWRDYGALPDADPAVLGMLHDAIAKNLAFTACHWLPQPDGTVIGPTAMMTRKIFSFAGQGWPGTKLARQAFPLAAAQWLLTPEPTNGIGVAGLMPHFVNRADWARRALAEIVPAGDARSANAGRGVPAAWTHEAVRAAKLTVATPAVIPCRATSGLWEVPGQIAWKQGALYGLVFWGTPGTPPPVASCRMGGAPSALWSASTGTFLLSQHNTHFEDGSPLGKNGVATADDLTHACVFGRLDKALWWSGREVATLAWTDPGHAFRISGRALAAPAAPVSWTYGLSEGSLELTVEVTLTGLETPVLNLPLLILAPGAEVVASVPGSARFNTENGTIGISWGGTVEAVITASLATGIAKVASGPVRCLRIALLRSGETWSQRVRFVVER